VTGQLGRLGRAEKLAFLRCGRGTARRASLTRSEGAALRRSTLRLPQLWSNNSLKRLAR
jgi:hypothetical protein